MGTLYLLYFLRDQVKLYQHDHIPAATGLLILIVIYTVCVILTAIIGGIYSDRIGQRKMIVTASRSLIGVAALLLTFIANCGAPLVAAVLLGTGLCAFLAVHHAL